ncbi:ABC transporter substrate-binding protein [Enemella sp. A6]|uniref:ABC transporter substrate-binding protein n=1 Tax=Enemella sp. A6 TaxID=3440152 RepID=UPI003EB71B90
MIRPKALAAVAIATGLALSACSPSGNNGGGGSDGEKTVVTVRLWDEQIKKAYDKSFEEFEKQNDDIDVRTVLVPWADYFTKLRTDMSGNNADDLFMINSSYIQPYIKNNNLVEIGSDFDDLKEDWVPAAVEQYTHDDKLWGVPALTDGGIAVYYNEDLLTEAGLTPEDLADLTWNPDGQGDTFLPVAQKLTKDASGKRGDESGFDGSKPGVWGYSAAQDLQGIYYNFVGSNGGKFQDDDGNFVFDSPEAAGAFQYLVDLINKHKVAPAASNTNNNGDFTRDQFLQGKIVLFQSGIYNLKNVADGADFTWGIAPIPAGPKGRVSVVNTVVVAGNAGSDSPEETKRVLRWLGSDGAKYLGESGAALPAVISAQDAYNKYWEEQKVDPSQFVKQGNEESIGAPSGENYGAAVEAFKPVFDEIFLGRTPVEQGLASAQSAANEAMKG